ncbi:FliM/FliN family flagellar motor switch protein [Pseudomonas sp. NPDC090208]|uniref:FliM/FliN family flagellar motor switch protein n=1 Tax=Pseudomonas sp. NPDC090208 TaxID=3364478 RepID=UPI0038048236
MSLRTLLRSIDPLERRRAELIRHWIDEGLAVTSSVPVAGACYLAFTAVQNDGEWRAVVNSRQWLTQALPGLEELLPRSCPEVDIGLLFAAAEQPICPPARCLEYQIVTDVRLLHDAASLHQPLPALETAQGTLWVTHPPSDCNRSLRKALPKWVLSLPMPLAWVIGYSQLPQDSAARLAHGDVLQICECRWDVVLFRRVIGRFSPTDEGLIVNITANKPEDLPDEIPALTAVAADLPMHLEFVLHESTVSVLELSRLIDGGVMPLAQNSAYHVQVRANGQKVAEGELVQWGDCLGVELHTLHRGEA